MDDTPSRGAADVQFQQTCGGSDECDPATAPQPLCAPRADGGGDTLTQPTPTGRSPDPAAGAPEAVAEDGMSISAATDGQGIAETAQPADPAAMPVRLVPAQTDEPSRAAVIEALLFSTDVPLSAARLGELLGGVSVGEVRRHVEELNARYERAGLSFRIEPIARGYQMMTLPQYKPWIARLVRQHAETRLGEAALETLAIIAYKQPIIRADIDAIRGVSCSEVLARLREMGLVRVVGRAEVVGRPLLYGTTRRFLDVFGLSDLKDLPPMESFKLRPKAAASTPQAAPPSEVRAAAGA